MIITKGTIQKFASRGIIVKYYPDATYEDFVNRKREDEIKRYCDYYKDHVAGCDAVIKGLANKLFDSFEELEQRAINNLKYNLPRVVCPYEYTTLYVQYDEGNAHRCICKKINGKSKEITDEYIQKLIDKDKKMYSGYYGKFADGMNKLLKEVGADNYLNVYPTTYGIGVWVFYNWHVKNDVQVVEDLLKRYGIEYYNEYSDKMWVYRFKVSKRKDNISRLPNVG